MSREQYFEQKKEVLKQYNLGTNLIEDRIYGSGHINDTFLLNYEQSDGSCKRYILQKMNTDIFKNINELMENISNVTRYLRNIIIKNGGDPERETINIISSITGNNCYIDSHGSYWRVMNYIENATSYDSAATPEIFYESAVAFGNFQYLLSDYPADTLYETIPDFHNTPLRLEMLKKAVKEDPCSRGASVRDEIQFALEREKETGIIVDMLRNGSLPLRVTHNDTKLNNIMMDNHTGKGICVIDLDTVMPGSSLNDFGDSIRFGANTALEDETDLTKVSCDLKLYDIYTKGFLEGCKGSLTDTETRFLPIGAKLMTYECGIRFLTDYLLGDVYFKIHREHHNLDRCRTQFRLVEDMEQKWVKIQEIINKYRV